MRSMISCIKIVLYFLFIQARYSIALVPSRSRLLVHVLSRGNGDGGATKSSKKALHDSHDDHYGDGELSRRSMIGQILSSASAPLLTQVHPAFASDDSNTSTSTSTNTEQQPNLNCLLDLPPISKDCVRLYLCRHGQTENNRLRLVQGSRVDPPLNTTGKKQAIRLGETLSNLKQSGAPKFPTIAMHSTLQRARETAAVASLTIGKGEMEDDENLIYVNRLFSSDPHPPINVNEFKDTLELQTLSSLGEVDFGSAEGKSVSEARAEMMGTFAQWAIGKIDVGNGDDGESGRSVLTRASSALNALLDVAALNGGSAIAVTHSTYLRILLCLVLDVPLVESASFDQRNCCINVLDINVKEMRTVGPKANIFGGKLSVAPRDFSLTVPSGVVVRMNEIRHLEGLL